MSNQRFVIVLALLVGIALSLSAGEYTITKPPRFEDFPVSETAPKEMAPLRLSKNDRLYRTRLKIGSTGQPNFAGHFILTIWGCGALCRMGAAIDTKSGRVHWLPGTVCCWDYPVEENPNLGDPILFHHDSRLIILTGLLNETGVNGSHYFQFENGKFIHLLTIPSPPRSAP